MQPGLSDPLALLIDEESAVHQAANRNGFCYFTDEVAFKQYVMHEILGDKRCGLPELIDDQALPVVSHAIVGEFELIRESGYGRRAAIKRMWMFVRDGWPLSWMKCLKIQNCSTR